MHQSYLNLLDLIQQKIILLPSHVSTNTLAVSHFVGGLEAVDISKITMSGLNFIIN